MSQKTMSNIKSAINPLILKLERQSQAQNIRNALGYSNSIFNSWWRFWQKCSLEPRKFVISTPWKQYLPMNQLSPHKFFKSTNTNHISYFIIQWLSHSYFFKGEITTHKKLRKGNNTRWRRTQYDSELVEHHLKDSTPSGEYGSLKKRDGRLR